MCLGTVYRLYLIIIVVCFVHKISLTPKRYLRESQSSWQIHKRHTCLGGGDCVTLVAPRVGPGWCWWCETVKRGVARRWRSRCWWSRSPRVVAITYRHMAAAHGRAPPPPAQAEQSYTQNKYFTLFLKISL